MRENKRSARALAVFLALAAVSLSLSTCQLLFGGPYSGLLAQVTAKRDMSDIVAASSASRYNFAILKSGNSEFVLLFSSSISDPSQNWLIVLSPNLKVLRTYTGTTINSLPPGSISFSGTGAVSHLVDSTLVIGNVVAEGAGGTFVLDGMLAGGISLNGPTVFGPSSESYTYTGFTTSSAYLNWNWYSGDWTTSGVSSAQIGGTAQFCGVFSDPEDPNGNVAFLVFSENSGRLSFVEVPKYPDLFWGGQTLLGNSEYRTYTKNGLNSFDIHMTTDSVIGFDGGSNSWVRFAPSKPDTESRLYVGKQPNGQKTEFSFSGGYFCMWDPTTLTMTRAEDWW